MESWKISLAELWKIRIKEEFLKLLLEFILIEVKYDLFIIIR